MSPVKEIREVTPGEIEKILEIERAQKVASEYARPVLELLNKQKVALITLEREDKKFAESLRNKLRQEVVSFLGKDKPLYSRVRKDPNNDRNFVVLFSLEKFPYTGWGRRRG